MSVHNRISARRTEYDILRILAIFAVVMIHVVGNTFFPMTQTDSLWWNKLNILDGSVRWGVPVLLMISGTLFLDPQKEVSVQTLYGKYILRILTAFLFWSVLYAVAGYLQFPRELDLLHYAIDCFVSVALKPRYHLWYIYAIIGLYMITPLLRLIVQHATDSLLRYWMVLMYIFGLVVPALLKIDVVDTLFGTAVSYTHLDFLGGYVFYYVIGYYISTRKVKHEGVVYMTGFLSYVFSIVATTYLSARNSSTVSVYENLSPTIAPSSIAVFVFFKERVSAWNFSEKWRNRLKKGSEYMFAVYLMHDLILQLFAYWGITIQNYPSIFAAMLIGATAFLICTGIAHLLSKNKLLKKYIM